MHKKKTICGFIFQAGICKISQLCLESKTEPRVAEAQNNIEGGGDTAEKIRILGGGATAQTLLMGKQSHNIKRYIYTGVRTLHKISNISC